MRIMMRLLIQANVCLLLVLCPSLSHAGRFVAYSLNSAQRMLSESDYASKSVAELGGITRIAGMVYDSDSNDIILVGEVYEDRKSITLDELVVAFRALLIEEKWPSVSIDRTHDTTHTGQQTVRFDGNIEGTMFGRQFLDADIALKKLALGELQALNIDSYFELSRNDIMRNGLGNDINTRFWFYAIKPAIAVRRGVFAIKQLKIGVCTQVMSAVIDGKRVNDVRDVRDPVGDAFSETLTAHHDELADQFPEIGRLKALFDLVAIAKGLQSLNLQPYLQYWLNDYEVADVKTPTTYPLLARKEKMENGNAIYNLEVNGGVQLKALLIRLKDGDVTALRDAVLKTRPDEKALAWNVPLQSWHIPGSSDTDIGEYPDIEEYFDERLSCMINRSVTQPAADNFGTSFAPQALPNMMPEVEISTQLASQHVSSDIGGVMLSGTAKIEGAEKAQVNLAGGNFSLVVDGKNARIDPKMYRKFITALWCVYYGDQDPGISIDPPWDDSDDEEKDPEKWTKHEKHSVRYIGRVLNTDLGRVMREADYLMKKWAVGTEQPNYPGFFSVDRYAAMLGVAHKGVPTRFWFVPEDLSFKRGGDLLLFDGGRMRLNTEFDRDGMRGKAGAADEKFAEVFSRHYNDIAAQNPVFKELFEYAKLVSLAKYLKEQNVPLHWFLMANKDLVLLEDSPREVDGLLNRSKYVRGLLVKGGVDLAVTPTYRYDTETVAAVENMMARIPAVGMRATGMPGAVGKVHRVPMRISFDLGNRSYSVVPQHTLTSGKDHRGIRYQTDLALCRNGRPGLELVRYYDPRNRNQGEFGKGWRLLVPYRVKPADEQTQEFLNVVIPKRMLVENLYTGRREVLNFCEDDESGAGYVPEKPSSSQVVRMSLMSDASYRLTDKLGNQYQFDRSGYLADMFFSPNPDHHVHIEYADDFTADFAKTPYMVRPVGRDQVPFLNVMIPKQVEVTDLVHGDSEVLEFNETNNIPGYMPSDNKSSRYRLLAMLSNAGLQLIDKHGNQTVFDPGWNFRRMLPSRDQRIVRSISMGGQKATFGYTINESGEVIIASSSLSANTPAAPVTHVVRYEHDKEGRLCRVRHSKDLNHAEHGNKLALLEN